MLNACSKLGYVWYKLFHAIQAILVNVKWKIRSQWNFRNRQLSKFEIIIQYPFSFHYQVDEKSFEAFSVICGLALHHAKLYEKIKRSEQKRKIALDVLSYHSRFVRLICSSFDVFVAAEKCSIHQNSNFFIVRSNRVIPFEVFHISFTK